MMGSPLCPVCHRPWCDVFDDFLNQYAHEECIEGLTWTQLLRFMGPLDEEGKT